MEHRDSGQVNLGIGRSTDCPFHGPAVWEFGLIFFFSPATTAKPQEGNERKLSSSFFTNKKSYKVMGNSIGRGVLARKIKI